MCLNRVAEEMIASLRREALEMDRARSSARRSEASERMEASRKLDEINVQLHDKEARLQRLVREMESLEDTIRNKEAQFKSRFAAREEECQAKCLEMTNEAELLSKTKLVEIGNLNEKIKSAEQKLALLKVRKGEEEEASKLRKSQIEAKMLELSDMVATSEQQVEFAKRTAARVLKMTEERQLVASELGHRITSYRLAAEEAELRKKEAEEAVRGAKEMESDAENRKARTLEEMKTCRENADAIKKKVQVSFFFLFSFLF
jgi:chromosome segregation protein